MLHHDHHNDDHHHAHEHDHSHNHEHQHEQGQTHTHEHDHEHGHTHDHDNNSTAAHHHSGHDNLLGSKAEAAAFLQYTLHHNAHHEEEMDGLAHSLEHLELSKEAQEIRLAIEDIGRANARLEYVLKALS